MIRTLPLYVLLFFVVGLHAQVANQPDDIQLCDDNDDSFQIFDLTITESQILGAQSPTDFFVTYYEVEADANAGINAIAIPTSYINVSNPQSIFARLESVINGNFDTTNFALIVLPQPAAVQPTPLIACDTDDDGIFFEFDLVSKDAEIADGDPNVSISYHTNLADAETNQNPLASPYTNTTPFSEILYVRVEDIITGCFAIVELELIVWVDCPAIDTDPVDIFVNEGDDNGLAIFDLTANEALMLGSQDPSLFEFAYHETMADSDAGTNPIANPTAYQNIANPQTIYVRMTNTDNGSYVLTNFQIETDGTLSLDTFSAESFVLYPNPARQEIHIQSNAEFSEIELKVFDMHGRQLISEKSKQTIDVSQFPSGMYWIQILTDGNKLVKPFVKN
ncbi:T9SS type A sorting domain-containing protein [Aureisphaera galaxeae]|uniref:T9SS type A sorting domain-containing protein n=1 Tax=Aureisphaera galaxeae TaxID=1538023 RepID=UPI00234FC45C|nr:T9SS type A sorting domain-containing protein [Aureisphaera galaxeae]MDC8003462.1 T9SS type A sorting domain-containing protein [Aureisphaera galaxeae]